MFTFGTNIFPLFDMKKKKTQTGKIPKLVWMEKKVSVAFSGTFCRGEKENRTSMVTKYPTTNDLLHLKRKLNILRKWLVFLHYPSYVHR